MPLKSSLCYSVALATVATATLAPVASAATFNFSYTSSLGTITATVDGTLQPDNNTVFVSSISNTTFNGSAAPALPFVGSYLNAILAGVITGQAVLSLDGSGLDFVACDTTLCDNNGFGFLPPNGIIGNTTDLFASAGGYGSLGSGEPFVLANYSLTPAGTPTVPEPATVLGLLSVAGVGLLCKGRKLEG
ncbi:PEP-CTERM sorting domain-containing protein [Microcystis aeruginosa LEGE 00239]|uniref:PEP-CTERM sorting domain-containing protein n=1 Tax=Microcystis TaxID=1125 RepID=UPI0011910FB0|nr:MULTISPECIES: PEP-CTERM sorting domain-containing protein [Microcystis]MBE9243282.1 PEP-CTERM sorting domain-containing protein [Microcystis aeruginosa LEGE 00239]TRU11571.1 MAG: PEP-CTERM sorting domain-containing protein [Microcystis sp. Msp_OC_L_20101000_S702]